MKWTKHDSLFTALLILIILATLWLCSGCNTTKHTVSEKKTDTREQELTDSLNLVKSERDRFEQLYNEIQYAGVIFDTIAIRDTVNQLNTVYITKEGEIKAEGNIKSASVSKTVFNKIIAEKDRLIDSLRYVKSKTEVKKETVYKERIVKRSTWLFWLIVGLISGVAISNRAKIISFLRG